MKSKSIYRSFFPLIIVHINIRNSWTLSAKISKLRFNNAKLNYQAFYSIYRSRGVWKLVIPVGITRSERVNSLRNTNADVSCHVIDSFIYTGEISVKSRASYHELGSARQKWTELWPFQCWATYWVTFRRASIPQLQEMQILSPLRSLNSKIFTNLL